MNVDAERSGRAGSTARSDRDILANAHLSTEEGIYGLILVAGLVAVAGNAGLTSPQTLLFVLVTNSVFWTAHVYSGAVAAHSGSEALPLGRATRLAMRRSRGLLTAAIPPAVPLLLGTLGVIDSITADWIALWIIVGVLALLGFIPYRRKGAPLHVCLFGAACTAALGIVIILAKALLHH